MRVRTQLLAAFLGVTVLALAVYGTVSYYIVLGMGHGEDVVRTVGTRLVSSGLIVFWVAIWAGLLLASVIARRLDENNAILVHQALHDSLTELPNRTLLYDRLRELTGRKQGIALLVMDLDHFKEINDTLGHHFGDEILRHVGRRLGGELRETDTVARIGGDEFAVLLPDNDRAQAVGCAERLMHCFDAPFSIDDIMLVIKPSIGIALYPEHGEDADALVRHADVAMYHAKRNAKGFEIYHPQADKHSVRRLTLMSDLREAITSGQLQLYYQPKVTLHKRTLLGVEALLRWQHPVHGFIPPDEFIPLAEQTGLIHPLTDWVLNEALRQCARWCEDGLSISVAVNISAHSLGDQRLPERLDELLRAWRLPARLVELEITESAMMNNLEAARKTLDSLDILGVRLAIDDFGTGFSSLSYLKRLPVDTLKIDRSFVMDMPNNEDNAAIVHSIIDLAHNMDLEVVAEGVECAGCLLALTHLDCDTAQGYHIARPMPVWNFEQWMKESPWTVERSVVALKNPVAGSGLRISG